MAKRPVEKKDLAVVIRDFPIAGRVDGWFFRQLHLFLNRQGIPLALVLLVCMALLYRAYAPRYASLFAPGNP